MTARTAVRDAALADVSITDDHDALRALEAATLAATERACLDGHELLDWDEYREVAL